MINENIPVAQETSTLMSLGPFLVFDAFVVVVRRKEGGGSEWAVSGRRW
jgi:hypothetical protein